jgi:predicted CoA-binding protein
MTLTVALPELTNSNLRDALFSPRSVAIVGQSDDATKTAGRPLKFLRRVGYAGRVYPINPRRETVLGESAWPALAALPEAPDHAYIVTSTEAAVAAVEECGALGVKVATVLADGFAEAGAEGIARETRLRETCARTGIRIVGPSSLGVVDLRTRVMLTASAAFDEKDFPLGRVFNRKRPRCQFIVQPTHSTVQPIITAIACNSAAIAVAAAAELFQIACFLNPAVISSTPTRAPYPLPMFVGTLMIAAQSQSAPDRNPMMIGGQLSMLCIVYVLSRMTL